MIHYSKEEIGSQNNSHMRTVSLPDELVVVKYEDTGKFWKVSLTHRCAPSSEHILPLEYVERLITTPEIFSQYRLYFVSLPPSPGITPIPCGAIKLSGNKRVSDLYEFVDILVTELYDC